MLFNGILNGIKDLYISAKDVWAGYEYAKKHKFATCLYFKDAECFEFKGIVDPSNKTIVPKGINQQFEIDRGYKRFPQGDTVYLTSFKSPKTINIDHWDIELDDIKKASILSAIAYDIFRTSIFKYMTSQSKRDMILLIVIFTLAGLVMGILIGGGLVGGAG